MKLSEKEVLHVARLARLHLGNDELCVMTRQLDDILRYVDKLEEIDTEGIEPTTHAFSISNAFREDRRVPSLSQEDALKNCARKNDETFIVPRII